MTNTQVAEAFAEGRHFGHSLNMFINGDRIYSYGYHFPIAQITTKEFEGQRIALFTTRGYSNTTSKHKSHVRWALTEAGFYILECDINNPTSTKQILADLGLKGREFLAKAQRARKEWSKQSWMDQATKVEEDIRVVKQCFMA